MNKEYSRFVGMMREQGEKYNFSAPGIGKIKSMNPIIINYSGIEFDKEDIYFVESFFGFESNIIAEVEDIDISVNESHTHEIYSMQLQASVERVLNVGDAILVIPIRDMQKGLSGNRFLVCIDKVVSL